MKETMIKVLLAGVALACIVLIVFNGMWSDSKTLETRKDAQVQRAVIPTS